MIREQLNGGATAAVARQSSGVGKKLLKGAVGVAGLIAVIMGLSEYAHPKRPNTTEDNEYGLQPTNVCDEYGEPIIKDFRGILWNKSTMARLDLKNPPPLHYCSDQEMADAGYAPASQAGVPMQAGAAGAPMQKRTLDDEKAVSAAW